MQRGPISTENKDSYFTENTLVNKAEQENLVPVGMSKFPEPNTGNDCISQDHNILQADTSNNILKQKNGGELISSDSNQNFNCSIVGFIHDTTLQKKIENNKKIETELKDTCIDKESYVQSHLLNSKKGNSEDNSCTDGGDSKEAQGEMDVQEDENSISSSCIDSADSTSVPFALKSSSEGDDHGTTMAQDSGQFIQSSKDMEKVVKKIVIAHKSRKKKKKSLSKGDFHSYTWKLKDNCDVENYRNIYEVHVSWLKSLKNQQICVTNLTEYVLLVRIESCIAVAFNKIKNSSVEGVPFSNLCEAVTTLSQDVNLSELEYILSYSPLYRKMNDVWKKCYAEDGIKEENHWQGILYMRKIWANLNPSSEDRYKIVKFFLSNSSDKSADGLAKSICSGLHIPYCFDMVEKVLVTLKDLVRRKEVVRVTGSASSAPGGQLPEEVTRRPSGNSSPLLAVEKNVISSEKCSDGLTQETLSSLQSSSTVAKSEKSNVRKSENSDECMPDQSVSDSTVSSVSVGELSQTTVSSLGEAQKTCSTANFSEKSVEQNHLQATASGEQPYVNATTAVNSYIRNLFNKEENEVTKEPSVKQDSPISTEKQAKKNKVKINCCSPKGRGKKPFQGSVDDFFLPMAQGWVRELVRRAVSKSARYDVYYHPPLGPKLRSVVEIKRYLSEKKITQLSSQNFSFGKTPLGLGPPYELIRDAHVTRNYFKRKENDTLSPETPVEENTSMKKLKLSPASFSLNLTPLTGGPKQKRKRKRKVEAPVNVTLHPAAPTSTGNIHSTTVNESQARMLNESWDDEVDITNEVGETTGYEGWFTSNQTNQSSTHKKTKPAEPVHKIVIKSKIAGSCSVDKGQGVEATTLSGIHGKGSPPVKPSSSESSGEIRKRALSTGLNTETRNTPVQSHSQNKGKIPNIHQDGGQVLKSPWLDIIDKYEKRKIIRERNSDKKMFDSMPVGMKKYSNLMKKPVGTKLNLRLFPEPEPKSTTREKSVCRIRVKCFSELADVPRTSKNLNCVSESIQSVPMQTPICSSSVLGGKSSQRASGSGNSLVKRSSGHTCPQQPKPMVVLGFSSQNSSQVLKGSEPDLLAPVWHSPVLSVGTQVVVSQGSSAPVFGVSSPQPLLPYPSVNPTIRPANFNTDIASVRAMLPVASQIPIMQPRMQPLPPHNSLSSLAPTQQSTFHVTQGTSQPSLGTNFVIQNTRLSFQQRICQIQADTLQLSASTGRLHYNTENIQNNKDSNVGDTGFGFYRELSTTDGNG